MSYSLSKAISKFVDGKELTDWLYDFCETKDNDEIIEYVENYILWYIIIRVNVWHGFFYL